jgi:uncharacterized protein DUF3565
MERAIVGFETDEVGDWVALLACGHRQHVRHRPPWQERPWVLTPQGREGRLGTPLDCPLCNGGAEDAREQWAGGDPACWADRVCPACGAVVGGCEPHRPGCRS